MVTVVELKSNTKGYQNLEVKTEPQLPTIKLGKTGCINWYLHRLVVYHSC